MLPSRPNNYQAQAKREKQKIKSESKKPKAKAKIVSEENERTIKMQRIFGKDYRPIWPTGCYICVKKWMSFLDANASLAGAEEEVMKFREKLPKIHNCFVEVMHEFAYANPALDAARKALATLTPENLTAVKKVMKKNPLPGLDALLMTILAMFAPAIGLDVYSAVFSVGATVKSQRAHIKKNLEEVENFLSRLKHFPNLVYTNRIPRENLGYCNDNEYHSDLHNPNLTPTLASHQVRCVRTGRKDLLKALKRYKGPKPESCAWTAVAGLCTWTINMIKVLRVIYNCYPMYLAAQVDLEDTLQPLGHLHRMANVASCRRLWARVCFCDHGEHDGNPNPNP